MPKTTAPKPKAATATAAKTKPVLLVFPGGPGLSASYLKADIKMLFPAYKPVFIDTVKAKNFAEALEMAEAQVKAAGKAKLAFTHSWGSFLALSLLAKKGVRFLPTDLIFANPLPLTDKGLRTIAKRFQKRLPEATQKKIEKLLENPNKEAGAKIMQLGLPAYCGVAKPLPTLQFEFWPERCAQIDIDNASYDQTDIFAKVASRVTLLFGKLDYIQPKDLPSDAKRMTLPGGHFGFAEYPALYSAAFSVL